MTGLSSRMSPLAQRLIGKYGASAVVNRRSSVGFDPVTQTETGGNTTSDKFSVIVEDYRSHEINGDTIRYGDKKLTMAVSDLKYLGKPEPNDTIEVLDTSYRVVDVQGVSAGDDIVAYTVQVRN